MGSRATFFSRYLTDPSTIGAVAPTSMHTSRLMASFLPSSGPILEIGAGTGAITHAIVERIQDTSRLTSVEIDPKLANIFRTSFPHIRLLEQDAEHVTASVKNEYAAIVSGLPFTSLPPEKSRTILHHISQSLQPDGVFIAFQYTLLKKKLFKSHFKTINTYFSPVNLPPAFVFVCKKETEK